MTAEQEQVEALAEIIATHTPDLVQLATDGVSEGQHLYCVACGVLPGNVQIGAEHVARELAPLLAQVRAEATAAVLALTDSWVEKAGPESEAWAVWGPQKLSVMFAVAEVRAALTPDAGAALRAREAKALRDAADALAVDSSLTTGVRPAGDYNDARDDERIDNVQWLRDRADALEAGGAR